MPLFLAEPETYGIAGRLETRRPLCEIEASRVRRFYGKIGESADRHR